MSLFSRFLKLPALESNPEPCHPLTRHGSLPWQTLLEKSQLCTDLCTHEYRTAPQAFYTAGITVGPYSRLYNSSLQ